MFIYFIQTKSAYATREIQAVLPYAWKQDDCYGPQVIQSPFGPGLVLGRKCIPVSDLQFGSPEYWKKIPGKEAWIKQVGSTLPENLARDTEEFLDGHAVELADGNTWLVPRALAWHTIQKPMVALPRADELQPDGTWACGDVLPPYRKLWSIVDRIMKSEEWTYEDEVESIVTALQVHYYVGAMECSLLGILSKQHRWPVWNALMDTHGFAELKKKLEQDG